MASPAPPAKSYSSARRGRSTFRVLSYYFELEWEWSGVGEYVRHVLGQFEVPPDPNENRNPPTPGFPAHYRLYDEGRRAKNRYGIMYGEKTLIGSERASDVLFHLFWHINSEAIRRTGDFLLIHAGAVRSPSGQGVLLPGASGAGKTTLVAGLVAVGFDYLSDEAAAIDPVTRRLYPYPKAMTVKRQLTELFPDLHVPPTRSGWVDGQVHLRPEDIRPGSLGGACEVAFVITPRYVKDASTEVVPMTPAEAAVELGRNALNLSLYGSRALPALADVVRNTRGYRLVSGDLNDAVATVTRLTRSSSRRA